MKAVLENYARSICSVMDIAAPEGVPRAIDLFASGGIKAVCEKARLIENVIEAEEESDWDNICSRRLDLTLAAKNSEGLNFHLVARLSRIAPVAVLTWLEFTWMTINNDPRVPAGREFRGTVDANSTIALNQLIALLSLNGYFVASKSDFDFEVELGFIKNQNLRTVSGVKFFFGNSL